MNETLIRPLEANESRTPTQIREHYRIERDLADRLRRASREQRTRLYGEVYNELFQSVPHHPQLTRTSDPVLMKRAIAWQVRLLRRFLNRHTTFLEIGAGDCALSLRLSRFVDRTYASDVARLLPSNTTPPDNFTFLLVKDAGIPLPAASVDVVYSNQLFEHLHPDDAIEHLRNVYNVLKPGGVYVCVTPNKLSGPWDISMYFDEEATGFHLKEYTLHELATLFEAVAFRQTRCYAGARGWYIRVPQQAVIWLERRLARLPFSKRSKLARSLPLRICLGVRIVGCK